MVEGNRVRVLPNAGPDVMARSAGCKVGDLQWSHHAVSRTGGSALRQITRESPAQRARPALHTSPGSRAEAGIVTAEIQPNGEADSNA